MPLMLRPHDTNTSMQWRPKEARMFTKRIVYACASFAICGLLAVVLLLGLSFSRARAESGAGTGAVTRYVSPAGHDAGNDCASAAMPCHTVQHAVEAAQPGDEIRVAARYVYGAPMAAPASTGFYSATVVITKELFRFTWRLLARFYDAPARDQ